MPAVPVVLSRRSFLGRLLPAFGAALGAVAALRPAALLGGRRPPGAPSRGIGALRGDGSAASRADAPRTGRDADDEPSEAVKKVLRELFGDREIRTGHVQLDMPEDPPDGRLVPVFIESDLPMAPDDYVKAVHLLVDKNPDIHVAAFELTPALGLASIDTRIKMRATSVVRAIAETSRGEVWWATRKIFPATNGCG
ncbi:MAG TPA: thiosulfate oxidation carrier protein SoxY [Gemmatimonadota bacterium]